MKTRSFARFHVVAAIAVALLAFTAFPAARTLAQNDVVTPLDQVDDSGISGDASLTDNGDGTTTVDILVDGATGGHPAMIHSGSCATPGAVVYPLTDVDASGESLTVVDATLESLVAAGPYAIIVHLSADQADAVVACGDIPQQAAASSVGGVATATPAAAGGTTSVTDIGASGVGTTFATNSNFLMLALGAIAFFVLAGAFGLRRRDLRG